MSKTLEQVAIEAIVNVIESKMVGVEIAPRQDEYTLKEFSKALEELNGMVKAVSYYSDEE
jgi:hypothetical protein